MARDDGPRSGEVTSDQGDKTYSRGGLPRRFEASHCGGLEPHHLDARRSSIATTPRGWSGTTSAARPRTTSSGPGCRAPWP
jgi:hypothetical protein